MFLGLQGPRRLDIPVPGRGLCRSKTLLGSGRPGLGLAHLGSQKNSTLRHRNITYPKNTTRIIFEITVVRFEFFRINFGKKLPDTYCICVS